MVKLREQNKEENPLLLAAEYGSYKILKSITELGDKIRTREDFTFDDCNEYGENVLHLRKSFNSEYHHKNYDCLNLFLIYWYKTAKGYLKYAIGSMYSDFF